jgi:hypothetical protein
MLPRLDGVWVVYSAEGQEPVEARMLYFNIALSRESGRLVSFVYHVKAMKDLSGNGK